MQLRMYTKITYVIQKYLLILIIIKMYSNCQVDICNELIGNFM